MGQGAALQRRVEALGLRLLHLPETDSTNRVAGERAEAGEPGDLVVLADQQTAGRGRQGRQWHSPAGAGLFISLLRRPAAPATDAWLWTLLAGVAVHAAASEQRSGVWLKWPNDLMAGEQKLGGILCELQTRPGGEIDSIVVGIGVNFRPPRGGWPAELEGRAGAVWEEAEENAPSDSVDLTASLLSHFLLLEEGLCRGERDAVLLRARNAMTPMLGRRVRIEQGGTELSAHVKGLSDSGALEVVDEHGVARLLLAGDVHLLGQTSTSC